MKEKANFFPLKTFVRLFDSWKSSWNGLKDKSVSLEERDWEREEEKKKDRVWVWEREYCEREIQQG